MKIIKTYKEKEVVLSNGDIKYKGDVLQFGAFMKRHNAWERMKEVDWRRRYLLFGEIIISTIITKA
jgi:hypothetical protein